MEEKKMVEDRFSDPEVRFWASRIYWGKLFFLIGILGCFFLLYWGSISFRQEIQKLLEFFKPTSTGFDFEGLKEYLAQFGLWKAAGISALLMILQALVAPLPALVITIANGMLFGGFLGGVLALFSAILAAQLCYEVAQILGRPVVVALIGEKILTQTDQFMKMHGTSAILISRLIPVLPFDPISYAAGLTSLPRKNFLMGNLLGQIPATFIYSFGGAALVQSQERWIVLIPLFSLAIISLGVAVFSAKKNTNQLTPQLRQKLKLLIGTTFFIGGALTLYWTMPKLRLHWNAWNWARKAGAPVIQSNDLQKRLNEVLLIDAREIAEYNVSHLPGAYRLSLEDWKKHGWPASLPKQKPVVVYCTIGYRSGLLTNELRQKGMEALNLYGGIFLWATGQYPLVDRHQLKTAYVHPYDEHWGTLLGAPERLRYNSNEPPSEPTKK